MIKAGLPVDPRDLPAPLDWERPLWTLYERLANQWRAAAYCLVGIDLAIWYPEIHRRGWNMDIALPLLSVIERAFLVPAENERH